MILYMYFWEKYAFIPTIKSYFSKCIDLLLIYDQTPVNSPQPKKLRKRGVKEREENANSFTLAIESVMKRFDGLDGKLENIEARMNNVQEALKKFDALEVKMQNIEECTDAIKRASDENKENIEKLQRQVEFLDAENKSLKEKVLEAARYKRR